VTDIFMPGTDGLEFISKARRIAPNMPIIAMSGGPVDLRGMSLEIDILRVASSFGATACISKPFTTGQLVTLLRSALEDRQGGVQ
jgi:CheY-like chemotaxis protein